MEDSTLIARKIGEATLVTCATRAIFSATAPPPRRMNYIMATGFISYLSPGQRQSVSVSLYASRRQHRAGRQSPISASNESNAHIAAGEAGLGIVQTFTYSLKPALASGELVEILSAWRPAPYPFQTLSMPGTGTSRPGSASLLTGWRRFFPAAVQG
ncbi:LysR family transcriptional regulator [Klebsiella pneumoniae]|uniref:LysR family transcriptional regulator n=1 Tax=Klebsiella pneumoniae TaxID=573 RepID=A0A377WKW9_KLEPN|nr:LysR family transcriptional regulator [Klebsiella pneumoniae]